MKKLFLLLLLSVSSQSAFSTEYAYECYSPLNKNLFKVGQSQSLIIEIDTDFMLIENDSKIWNLLSLDKIRGNNYIFKSFSTGNTYATVDLIGAAPSDMIQGEFFTRLVLSKEGQVKTMSQDYSCIKLK